MTTFSNVVQTGKKFFSSAAGLVRSRPQEIALTASSVLTAGSAIGNAVAKRQEKKAREQTLENLAGQWADGSAEKQFIEELAQETAQFRKGFSADLAAEIARGTANIQITNDIEMASGHVQEIVDAIAAEQKASRLAIGGKIAKLLAAIGATSAAASVVALVAKMRGVGKTPVVPVDGRPATTPAVPLTKPAVPLAKPGKKPVHPGPWAPRY